MIDPQNAPMASQAIEKRDELSIFCRTGTSTYPDGSVAENPAAVRRVRLAIPATMAHISGNGTRCLACIPLKSFPDIINSSFSLVVQEIR
jgi:hypothetical protein